MFGPNRTKEEHKRIRICMDFITDRRYTGSKRERENRQESEIERNINKDCILSLTPFSG